MGLCGQCQYHQPDDNGDWVCANEESEYYSDWTTWGDGCECWEEKAETRSPIIWNRYEQRWENRCAYERRMGRKPIE